MIGFRFKLMSCMLILDICLLYCNCFDDFASIKSAPGAGKVALNEHSDLNFRFKQ